MIVEAYLELTPPYLRANFRDEEIEVKIKLEEDLDIECRLESEISISANFIEKYVLEE